MCQHCAEKHLYRYLAEFEFRYNNRAACLANDTELAYATLRGVVDKRLTYETTDGESITEMVEKLPENEQAAQAERFRKAVR